MLSETLEDNLVGGFVREGNRGAVHRLIGAWQVQWAQELQDRGDDNGPRAHVSCDRDSAEKAQVQDLHRELKKKRRSSMIFVTRSSLRSNAKG